MGPFCSQLHCSSSVLQGKASFLLFCISLATRYCLSVDLAAMEPKDWMLWAKSFFYLFNGFAPGFCCCDEKLNSTVIHPKYLGVPVVVLNLRFPKENDSLNWRSPHALIFRDFIFFSCILNCWYTDYNTNSQFNITFPEWTTLDASTQPVLTSFIYHALHISVDSSL